MNEQDKNLRPVAPAPPRKRRVSFTYLVTVALVVIVVFVAIKYYSQGMGAPVDPYLDLEPQAPGAIESK
jgi:hypothetical protein